MPFQSASQSRACFARRAEGAAKGWDCEEWASKTNYKKLPEHKKAAGFGAMLGAALKQAAGPNPFAEAAGHTGAHPGGGGVFADLPAAHAGGPQFGGVDPHLESSPLASAAAPHPLVGPPAGAAPPMGGASFGWPDIGEIVKSPFGGGGGSSPPVAGGGAAPHGGGGMHPALMAALLGAGGLGLGYAGYRALRGDDDDEDEKHAMTKSSGGLGSLASGVFQAAKRAVPGAIGGAAKSMYGPSPAAGALGGGPMAGAMVGAMPGSAMPSMGGAPAPPPAPPRNPAAPQAMGARKAGATKHAFGDGTGGRPAEADDKLRELQTQPSGTEGHHPEPDGDEPHSPTPGDPEHDKVQQIKQLLMQYIGHHQPQPQPQPMPKMAQLRAAVRPVILRKIAGEYRAHVREQTLAYLDKTAGALPVAGRSRLRLIQSGLESGLGLGAAIKRACAHLTPEEQGVLAARIVAGTAKSAMGSMGTPAGVGGGMGGMGMGASAGMGMGGGKMPMAPSSGPQTFSGSPAAGASFMKGM